MNSVFLARAIWALLVVLGMGLSAPLSAQDQPTPETYQWSEKDLAFLEGFASASDSDRRIGMVVLASRGDNRYLWLAIQEGLLSPDTQYKYTLLTAAAENGHLSTVKMLVALGADIELKDGLNDTPLKTAAREGHLGIVQYLLLSGANPNSEGGKGTTPLSSATYAGEMLIIEVLIANGARMKANDARWTLLHYAAKYGHSELVEFYISKGIDIDQRTNNGWTALALAAEAGHAGAVATLIANDADVDNPNNKKHSPTILAAKNGFLDIVASLVSAGAKVDYEDQNKRSALWWAAAKGQKRVVEYLLQNNARSGSAVSLLAKSGDLQAVETLIESGMALDAADENGLTGMHIAARHGHLDVVKLFVNNGLGIHATDNKGYIALHRAAGYGHTKVVRYLLDNGSNADWQGRNNRWTPVSSAARFGHLEILKMLHLSGGSLGQITSKGWSPLMLAAYGKKPHVVEYLLSNNVNTTLKNNKRKTAYDIALESDNEAVIDMLSVVVPAQ